MKTTMKIYCLLLAFALIAIASTTTLDSSANPSVDCDLSGVTHS